MYERAMNFGEFVQFYGLARSEGIVLRYLADCFKALRQTVPDNAKTEELIDLIEWLGEVVRQTDSSLLDEWEQLTDPGDPEVEITPSSLAAQPKPITTNERAFHKCLNDLLRLRAEKRKQQIGFESQKQKEADQTRRTGAATRNQELHKWRVLLAQAQVDNQELQKMRLETPEHRIHGRIERIIAAENAA